MSRVIHYTPILFPVIMVGTFLVLFYEVGYIQSKFLADWLALIGLSFMSASTLPVALRAIRNKVKTGTDKLILSYWMIWTMALVHRVWVIILAMAKAADMSLYNWLYFGPVSGILALGFAMAAGFGGAAPLQGELPLPKRELIIFTVAAGFSGIIAGIGIGVYYVAGWVN